MEHIRRYRGSYPSAFSGFNFVSSLLVLRITLFKVCGSEMTLSNNPCNNFENSWNLQTCLSLKELRALLQRNEEEVVTVGTVPFSTCTQYQCPYLNFVILT
jgi:hypothetical protein